MRYKVAVGARASFRSRAASRRLSEHADTSTSVEAALSLTSKPPIRLASVNRNLGFDHAGVGK